MDLSDFRGKELSIRLDWCRFHDINLVLQSMVNHGRITNLSLNNCGVLDSHLKLISSLQHLRSLNIGAK
jgi:hypothetical protein